MKGVYTTGHIGDIDHLIRIGRLDVSPGFTWSTFDVLELSKRGRHIGRHTDNAIRRPVWRHSAVSDKVTL